MYRTFATFTFSANAQTYPDFTSGDQRRNRRINWRHSLCGIRSCGDKFYTLDLKDPSAQWKEIAHFQVANAINLFQPQWMENFMYSVVLQKNEKGELQLVNDAYRYQPKR